MSTALNREDILRGLRELVVELRNDGQVAGIRLVGGAALALQYFDRGTTQDLDSLHIRPGSDEAASAAAARVAQRNDWDPKWLNFEVTHADSSWNEFSRMGRPYRRCRPELSSCESVE